MADPKKPADHSYTPSHFNSECCDILEIREEDTKPGGKLNEAARQRLREKYGKKNPSTNGPTENGSAPGGPK